MSNNDFTWAEMGRRIRALRYAKGFTQDELAVAAQISASSISFLETGQVNPTLKSLQQVASALECTVRQLLCGDDMSKTSKHCTTIERVVKVLNSQDADAIQAFRSGLTASETVIQRGLRSVFATQAKSAISS